MADSKPKEDKPSGFANEVKKWAKGAQDAYGKMQKDRTSFWNDTKKGIDKNKEK